ncbi:MAG TPA: acyl-CoA dehydrogenase family protein [Candidatus Limnocylindrales bacterium]|jgi:alkylation response protein AidB-like acyl-CoA dehydrogenase|nr:acyl-CoA dehydrogenase family protein [Candidatus Limnocylindrales bacterium]
MDFSISPQMQKTLADIQQFMEREVYPLEPEVATKGYRASLPKLKAARQKVKDLGLWCPQISKEYGGMGLDLMEHGMVSSVLGRSLLGHYIFNCQAPDAGNMEILIEHGTQEQKKAFLEPLLRGDIRSCFAMTEPEHAGSNPTWMSTTAVKEGSDYVINGHKWFASSADGATFAVTMAVTNPDAPPHQRASQILVPTNTPGFRIVKNLSVMGHVGEDHASHAEVRFENCRVPQKNLLGKEGAGFAIAQERLGAGRIHHCMRWLGLCERAYDLMCKRAAERELAPGKPLGTRQIVQAWIAESRAEINAARLMVLEAAWKIQQHGQRNAREEISCIKFYVAGVLLNVLDRAIQTHGGMGLTTETPLAAFWAAERGARIYDGPDEVHKMVVARQALKKYGVQVST